jgi:hypothetical protein
MRSGVVSHQFVLQLVESMSAGLSVTNDVACNDPAL